MFIYIYKTSLNKCFCFARYFIKEQKILAAINNAIVVYKNASKI